MGDHPKDWREVNPRNDIAIQQDGARARWERERERESTVTDAEDREARPLALRGSSHSRRAGLKKARIKRIAQLRYSEHSLQIIVGVVSAAM